MTEENTPVQATPAVRCSDCDCIIEDEHDQNVTRDSNIICSSCYENDYFTCDDCGDIDRADSAAYHDGDSLCNMCHNSRLEDERERETPEVSYREWRPDDRLQDTEQGKVITSPRTFGVELEVCYKSTSDMRDALALIPSSYGVQSDASIRSGPNHEGGCEIVSPPMSGKRGEESIKKVCNVLRQGTATVNASCGFHVHISAPRFARNKRLDRESEKETLAVFEYDGNRDIDWNELERVEREALAKGYTHTRREDTRTGINIIAWRHTNKGIQALRLRNLVHFYVSFEDVILGMLPKSRRGNRYCAQLRDTIPDELKSEYAFIEQKWYSSRNSIENGLRIDSRKDGGKYDNSRYHGINLHILFATGKTLEVRYHSGTLDAQKILNWIALHQRILDIIEKERNVLCFDEHRNKTHMERVQVFTDILKLEPRLAAYVNERTAHFSDEPVESSITISNHLNTTPVCAE